ncbi:MAG: hypothetical protein MHM6MM_001117 [Cercozoa sp. M6MM]
MAGLDAKSLFRDLAELVGDVSRAHTQLDALSDHSLGQQVRADDHIRDRSSSLRRLAPLLRALAERAQQLHVRADAAYELSTGEIEQQKLVDLKRQTAQQTALVKRLQQRFRAEQERRRRHHRADEAHVRSDVRAELLRGGRGGSDSSAKTAEKTANFSAKRAAQRSRELTISMRRVSRMMNEQIRASHDAASALGDSTRTMSQAAAEFKQGQTSLRRGQKKVNKLHRRRLTDAALVFLAFGFFAMCCFSVVLRRVFRGQLWRLIEFLLSLLPNRAAVVVHDEL